MGHESPSPLHRRRLVVSHRVEARTRRGKASEGCRGVAERLWCADCGSFRSRALRGDVRGPGAEAGRGAGSDDDGWELQQRLRRGRKPPWTGPCVSPRIRSTAVGPRHLPSALCRKSHGQALSPERMPAGPNDTRVPIHEDGEAAGKNMAEQGLVRRLQKLSRGASLGPERRRIFQA